MEARVAAMEARMGARETRMEARETRMEARETRIEARETRMLLDRVLWETRAQVIWLEQFSIGVVHVSPCMRTMHELND